ncbi:sialidase family protein, partial [Planctomycetota bacterium]
MKKALLVLAVVLMVGGYQTTADGAQQSQEGQILEALKEARLAGDIQAAQALQAQLDELHGIPPRTSPPPAHEGLIQAGTTESSGDISIDWVGDVRVTSSDYNHVKPSIASSLEGDLWVAVETTTGYIDVYNSTNGGASWLSLISFYLPAGSLYNPSIAYAKSPSQDEEWVYVAFEAYIDADSSRRVEVFRCDPNCPYDKFDFTIVESGIYMTQHIYPEICTDNNLFNYYYVYVTYAVEHPDTYPVWFSKSTDFGASWGTPQNVTGSTPTNYGWPTRPDIAYGKSGLFIAFVKPGYTGSTWENQVWETHSTNYGSIWTTPYQLTSSADNQYHPSVAAAVDPNTVMVAYTREIGTDLDIEYAYSTDEGATWKKNLWLPYTSNDEMSVDLAVSNGPGRFHAVYWRNNNIHYTWVETADPISWASTQIINEGSTVSSTYTKPTICINPQPGIMTFRHLGTAHIFYYITDLVACSITDDFSDDQVRFLNGPNSSGVSAGNSPPRICAFSFYVEGVFITATREHGNGGLYERDW